MQKDHARAKYVEYTFDARTEVKAAPDDNGRRIITGIATTPSPDRVGDIVLPEGATFQLPIPLLFSHDPERPIGNVTSAVVTPRGIAFTAELAPAGVAAVIDQRYGEIVAGLWRYVSIGFRALKSKASKTGRVFESWEWLELSLVSIPANADAAITQVKAFQVPTRDVSTTPVHTGAPAHHEKNSRPYAMNKTLAERIADTKNAISDNKERITELADSEDIDEAKQAEIDELANRVELSQKQLTTLETAERSIASKAEKAAPRGYLQPQLKSPVKADLLFKTATAHFLAHVERRSLSDVVDSYYPGHDSLQAYMKATPAIPANTATPGWAAELVNQTNADFLESLIPISVYASLASYGNRFTFGRNGRVVIPSRASNPPNQGLAGDFVGEGLPIRVGQAVLTSITMIPHKAAVISTFTRQLAEHSTPQIEALIRQQILDDTAGMLDIRLLDGVAASAIRPASILNGVVGVPSSGNTGADIVADIRAALSPIIAAGGGRKLVWLINPARLIGLSTVQTAAGGFLYRDEVSNNRLFGYPFIVSNNVPADELILVDSADFAVADSGPDFSVSDVATLHMEQEKDAVLPIVGGTAAAPVAAAPVRSLWQTDSIGVRFMQDVTWAMRRPGMVTQVTGIAW